MFDHSFFKHSGSFAACSQSRYLSFLILDKRLVNEVYLFLVSCMLKRGYSSEDVKKLSAEFFLNASLKSSCGLFLKLRLRCGYGYLSYLGLISRFLYSIYSLDV